MNQSKKIIIFFIALFFLSSASLFFAEKYYKNSSDKNWWAVYFENPKDDNLNFIIENNTASGNFRWELWSGDNKIKEGVELINKGNEKTVEIKSAGGKEKSDIKVFLNNEKKEIYKNF